MIAIAHDPQTPPGVGAKLITLAGELRRNVSAPRKPPRSASMTPQLAQAIRDYAKANPNLTQDDVARHFKVNSGRVSEVLHGKRK